MKVKGITVNSLAGMKMSQTDIVSGTINGTSKLFDPLVFRKLLKIVVAREGLEPPTRGFSIRCSTN